MRFDAPEKRIAEVVFEWTSQGIELAAQTSSAKLIAVVSRLSGKSTTTRESLI
jgi:hypothetical protein